MNTKIRNVALAAAAATAVAGFGALPAQPSTTAQRSAKECVMDIPSNGSLQIALDMRRFTVIVAAKLTPTSRVVELGASFDDNKLTKYYNGKASRATAAKPPFTASYTKMQVWYIGISDAQTPSGRMRVYSAKGIPYLLQGKQSNLTYIWPPVKDDTLSGCISDTTASKALKVDGLNLDITSVRRT